MTTSYETMELIASHHAELCRLCDELLETGSRLTAEDPRVHAFRERVRALGWRLRAHRAEEAAALIAEARVGGDRLAALLRRDAARFETVLQSLDENATPVAVARAACRAAREYRADLDELARAA